MTKYSKGLCLFGGHLDFFIAGILVLASCDSGDEFTNRGERLSVEPPSLIQNDESERLAKIGEALRTAAGKLDSAQGSLALNGDNDPKAQLLQAADTLDKASVEMKKTTDVIKEKERDFQRFESVLTPDKVKLSDVQKIFDGLSEEMRKKAGEISEQSAQSDYVKKRMSEKLTELDSTSHILTKTSSGLEEKQGDVVDSLQILKDSMVSNLDDREAGLDKLNKQVSDLSKSYESFSNSQAQFSSDVSTIATSSMQAVEMNKQLENLQSKLKIDLDKMKITVDDYQKGLIPQLNKSMAQFIETVNSFRASSNAVGETYLTHRSLLDQIKSGPLLLISNEIFRLQGISSILAQLIASNDFVSMRTSLKDVLKVVDESIVELNRAVADISKNVEAQDKLSSDVAATISAQREFTSSQEKSHAIQKQNMDLLEKLVSAQVRILSEQDSSIKDIDGYLKMQKELFDAQVKAIAVFQNMRNERAAFEAQIASTISATRKFIIDERENIARLREIAKTKIPKPNPVVIKDAKDLANNLINNTLEPGNYILGGTIDLGGGTVALNITGSTLDGGGNTIKNGTFVGQGITVQNSIIRNIKFENVTFQSTYAMYLVDSEAENIVIRGVALHPECVEGVCAFNWAGDFIGMKSDKSKVKQFSMYLHVDSMGLTGFRARSSFFESVQAHLSSSNRLNRVIDSWATGLSFEASRIEGVRVHLNVPNFPFVQPWLDSNGYVGSFATEWNVLRGGSSPISTDCNLPSVATTETAPRASSSILRHVTLHLRGGSSKFDFKDTCTASNRSVYPKNMPASVEFSTLEGRMDSEKCYLGSFITDGSLCSTPPPPSSHAEFFTPAVVTHPNTPKPAAMSLLSMKMRGESWSLANGFKVAPESFNWGGLNEKWFKDGREAFYFIHPKNMGIYLFTGGKPADFFAKSNFIGYASPAQYANLSLLFLGNPGMAPLVTLNDLKKSLGFVRSPEAFNAERMTEKWLKDSAGKWLFILPNGALFRWDGSTSKSAFKFPGKSNLLGYLSPEHYQNLESVYSVATKAVPVPIQPAAGSKISHKRAVFSWSDTGHESYELQVNDMTAVQKIANPNSLAETRFSEATLSAGRKYRYWVRGTGAQWSLPVDFETLPAFVPQPLYPKTGAKISVNSPYFEWTVQDDLTYEFWLYNLTAASYVSKVSGIRGSSFKLNQNLVAGNKYRWWIRADDGPWGIGTDFTAENIVSCGTDGWLRHAGDPPGWIAGGANKGYGSGPGTLDWRLCNKQVYVETGHSQTHTVTFVDPPADGNVQLIIQRRRNPGDSPGIGIWYHWDPRVTWSDNKKLKFINSKIDFVVSCQFSRLNGGTYLCSLK